MGFGDIMHLKQLSILFTKLERKKRKSPAFFHCFFFGLYSMIFLFPMSSTATHISGADLTYRWISGNTYEITLTLYRDCSGIAAPNSVTINYKSASCGSNNNITLNKVSGTGLEITQPCSTATTTCNGGSNPGIQKYEYIGTVTLGSACSDWVFSYSVCCRNCAITTLTYTPNNCSGVPATYVEATLNNLTSPANSSPVYTNPPLSFLCLGQTFHYNHGVYDADGDSLVYSLITPRSAQGTNVVFDAGYSATSPISSSPALTINAANGDMTMNPSQVEVAVMAILINEYRNGVLIGTVVRDMEVWTQACSNLLPTATGINGTNNYSTIACPGNPITFNINSNDLDVAQSLTMSWNNGIPGATFNVSSASHPVGTFSWTPTAADARAQPYTFTVTVQDDACPANAYQTYSYSITVPQFTASISGVNSNCGSPLTGSASVTATGNGPFQYLWSPGGNTTSSISNLAGGTYSVLVTNANGCTLNPSVTISSPSILNANLTGITQVTCFGLNNGSVSVNASGGTSPYTYSWSPSGGSGASATGLSPGTYTVTVTDSKGCTKTASTTITQPATLITATGGSALQCFGLTNGTASVGASGGTTPYTYSWSNGGTTSSINSLSSGSYTVTVTDARGCTATGTSNVTQPAALGLSVSITQSLCGLANGGASVTVSGGVPSYNYNWLPGGNNSSSISNVLSGNYTVTVTDNNGCTISSAVGISNISGPQINLTSLSDATCFGLSNGSASVSLSGGNGPFTYSWSPSGGTSSTATGLATGNYMVTVTDVNNCVASIPLTINEPPLLQLSTSPVNPTCFALNNGSISANAAGGTPSYTYSWSGGFPNSSTINYLSPGTYSVQVTDTKGCTDTATVTLTEPSQLTASVSSIADVSCFGSNNGSASITSSGGTTPYSYNWTPGGYSLSSISGLSPGVYTVQVTDANNCTVDVPFAINEPPVLNSIINQTAAISCYGDNNGMVQVVTTGGTPQYSYIWNPNGETTSSVSNIITGNYSVLVTDANGCTSTSSISVNEPAQLNVSAINVTNVSCFGGGDGSATIDVSGGTAPFTYQWSSGGASGNISTTLIANTYSVVVTDANGCSDSVSFTITEPTLLSATISSTPALCKDAASGSATVIPSGGSPPYYYTWNPGNQNTATVSGLNAGTYSVLITDVRGCAHNISVAVSEPTPLSLTTSVVSAKCGKSNGSASVSVTGGTPGYTYLWSNNTTASNITKVFAGGYTIEVTDANGCVASDVVTVQNTTGPTASINSVTNVTCYGGNNGAASIIVNGGSLPYSYTWSTIGGSGLNATGLQAGTYVATVTDNHNCIGVVSIDVLEPPQITPVISTTPVTCPGGGDGSANVTATGGTGALTYTWNTGVSGNSISMKQAGAYSVTITDQINCTSTFQVNIPEPPSLIANMNLLIPVSCNGGQNAAAEIVVTGGTSPYRYLWNETNDTNSSVNGLAAGNYNSIVTDANGCTTTSAIIINEPTPLIAQASTTIGTCNQSNGSATAIANGGTPPYTYFWQETGQTTSTIAGLSSGSYTVTITDVNGCESSVTANVMNTGMLSVSLLSSKPVSCFMGSDGEALVTAVNGSPPYSYSWQSGGTSAYETGLPAGTFDVIVTDTNNCSQTLSVVITEPTLLSASVTTEDVTCFGFGNGEATVVATGGTGAYTYSWQPGGSISSTISSLAGGNYNAIVFDENGCSITVPFTINEPAELRVNTFTTLAGCMLSNGTATALPVGGIPPYNYEWSPGQSNTSLLENIPAGSYAIEITDANGCTAISHASVSNTVSPSVSVVSNIPASCFGGSDGSTEISITNGTGPFTYNWFPNGDTTLVANNLAAGDYSFTVRDSNNCFSSTTVTIAQPPVIAASVTSQAASCFGGSDGSIQSVISGGTSPYNYLWSNGDTTSLATNLPYGTYSLMVTDANGCQKQFFCDVNQSSLLTVSLQTTDVNCFNGSDGMAMAIVTGGSGNYSYLWSNGSTGQTAIDLNSGNYSVTVTDSRGCVTQSSATINQPAQLTSTFSTSDVRCFGGSDGSATVIMNGGTSPYNYDWAPFGGQNNSAVNLSVGDYSVTIHDAHGCIHQLLIPVNSPSQLVLSTSSDSTHCYDGNDGSAQVAVIGGTSPYSYFWTNGSTQQTASQLLAGDYIVAVTDSNGCMTQQAVTINEPTPVIATTITPSIICIGQPALIQAGASGGTPGYTYSWNNGVDSIQQNVNPQTTTVYTVIAKDIYGCQSPAQSVTVSVQPPLAPTIATPDTICQGSSAVLLGFCSGGNGGPYHYSWNTGGTGTSITVTPTTTTSYFLTATDECGSPAVTTLVHVAVSPTPVVDFTQSEYSGCQPLSIDFADSTDMDGREYYWSFGDGESDITENPTHVYTQPGNYTVNHVVTSEMGCVSRKTKSAAVKVYAMPYADFRADPETTSVMVSAITFYENCNNTNTWEWNFGDQTGNFIQKDISHSYSDTGSYRVRLVTTSDKGCRDTTYKYVVIKGEFGFYIPNAFSPNNDNVNDVFAPLGLGIKSFTMAIYDRWGERIFTTTDLYKGWNGISQNGEMLSQSGVYVYVISVTDLQNKTHEYTGHVSLVR